MIPSSTLCPAKLPAPMMLNYSLGAGSLFGQTLPRHFLVRGRGPYHPALFIWVPIPLSRMPLMSPFSLLHALPAPHPCQRAKSPLGPQLRLGVPGGLGQARPLVPAAAPLWWALLGLCQATAITFMVYKQ